MARIIRHYFRNGHYKLLTTNLKLSLSDTGAPGNIVSLICNFYDDSESENIAIPKLTIAKIDERAPSKLNRPPRPRGRGGAPGEGIFATDVAADCTG